MEMNERIIIAYANVALYARRFTKRLATIAELEEAIRVYREECARAKHESPDAA